MADSALNITLALGAIILLIVGLAFVAKRLQGVRAQTGSGIELVTSRMLGPKERLVLVQVGRQQVLVGMNPQCISALATFDVEPSSFEQTLEKTQSASVDAEEAADTGVRGREVLA